MFIRTYRILLAVLLCAAAFVPLSPGLARPAAAAPDDVPSPVATGQIEEWSVGAGLVYWGDNCFADEFNPYANLYRKPSGGGTQRTLAAISDGNCITFRNQLAAADGLYYFSGSFNRIERIPLAEPFTPQEVKVLTGAQQPNTSRGFFAAGDYLYWPGYSNIFRTRKDGSGVVETVANTAASANDVMVAGATVYWSDSTGIWTTTTNCDTLPCTGSQQPFASLGANGLSTGLLYQPLGGPLGNYRVYWVERTGTNPSYTYSIRYRGCNQVAVCTINAPATFYSATTNWFIGPPILAGGSVYWAESDINNGANGDVKRRVYNASTPGADTIATGQSALDGRVYATTDTLFFARRGVGIYSLPLNAAAILRDFAADGLEITQGIQNLADEAPLVAQKTTYVRVYARELSGPNASNVEAWLAGTRNGSPLPGSPLRAINGARALTTGGSYDRARLDDGWYFLLPSSWTSTGAVAFSAVVDPRGIHSDPDRNNNTVAKTIAFQNQPPMCVWTVPVRTHTPLPSTKDANFWGMVSHFTRRWPVPDTWIYRDTEPVEELQVCWYGPFPYPCYGPYELSDGWSISNGPPDRDKVIMSLWARAQLTFNPDACDNIGAPVNFMGMVHPDADNGGASGYASLISSNSWVQLPPHTPNPIAAGWDKLRAGSVMAQELAHNFGRNHVNCGSPSGIDNGYPYPPCQIANAGPTSYYGFDTTTLQPIRPDGASDFMSYGAKNWVSDYTWRALFNAFFAAAQSAAVSAASAAGPAAGNAVFVSGMIDTAHNQGKISTVLQLPANTVPPATRQRLAAVASTAAAPAAVSYKLRLLDPNGGVLLERPITLQPLDDHAADEDAALFSDLFTPPAGQVAAIELLADGTVLDVIRPGLHAPAVAIQQPTAGAQVDNTLTIQWTAGDPDPQDRLLFTVQYSHDGGTSWHTIALDIPATPNPVTTLTLNDLGSLHGSGPNTALIRVLASDGYNTAIAVSQPFTLKNRPPVPAITAPAANEVFAAGPPVMLQGSATDAEDGGLAAAALQWQVDGVSVGTGPAVAAGGLAPGAHNAQLTATDADSQGATATTPFTIAPLSVPLAAAPVLDGACGDDAYAAGTSLLLKPYADASQGSVAVVRSADALWVCFSGLQKATGGPGAYAGVRADVDNSRSAQAQPADLGFFAGEDGSVFTEAGDGAGGFAAAAPSGLQAQVAAGANAWSAELRIPKDALGGWDHLVGLALGHHTLSAAGDDYPWPYRSEWAKPNTWAAAALGDQPVITSLDPYTATVNSTAFTLAVEGSGFVSGTVVLWNNTPLATTFVDAEHLAAQVDAPLLASPAAVAVSAQTPAGFASNSATFLVEAGKPIITSLAPATALAGSGTVNVAVTGSGFAADAQVLWNGTPLPTQFVSPTQLNVQVSAGLLAQGGVAGVAVRSQTPEERISLPAQFVIVQNAPLYMPFVRR